MATLMAAKTTASMNDRAKPGAIWSISALHISSPGSAWPVSRASYTTLYDTLARKIAPSTRNMIATGTSTPRNLPRMNSRRPTGLESNVSAVRPFDLVGDRHAGRPQRQDDRQDHDQRQALVLDHLDVFAQGVVGDEREEDQAADAQRHQHVEQRLRHGLLGGDAGDGGHLRHDRAQHQARSAPTPPRRPRTPGQPSTAAATRSTTRQTTPSDSRPRL